MVGTTTDVPLAANVCPCVSLSIPLSVADLGGGGGKGGVNAPPFGG